MQSLTLPPEPAAIASLSEIQTPAFPREGRNEAWGAETYCFAAVSA
jgi:hypothetical protein